MNLGIAKLLVAVLVGCAAVFAVAGAVGRSATADGYAPPPQAVGPVAYLPMPDKGKTYRAYQLPSHGIELEVNYGDGVNWYGHDLAGYSLPLGVNLTIFRLGDDATVVVQHTGTGYDYAKTWPIYTDADFAAGYPWVPYWHYSAQSNP